MDFNNLHYIPCLRWKQGEYQAILKLPNIEKEVIGPLIEVPEYSFDFEKKEKPKTIDKHLAPFAKRVSINWGKLPCFVDLKLIDSIECMSNGDHPVSFIFEELRNLKCPVIPVTGLNRNKFYQKETKKIIEKDKTDVCLRITIEQAAKNTIKSDLDELLKILETNSNKAHFILDLGAPSFLPLDGLTKLIQEIISLLPYLNSWKTLTFLATSFPESMGGIKRGIGTVPRYEWQLYRKLIAKFKDEKLRLPAFGDYTISHPKVLELDWRIIKPAATIRYTIDDEWCIVKGDSIKQGYGQFHRLCKQLISSEYYHGATFSYGDEYIKLCADKKENSGNLTTWRKVGTNHHITKVIRDIANFYAV